MDNCKVDCTCNYCGKCLIEEYEKCGKYKAYKQGRKDVIEEMLIKEQNND